MKKVKNFKVGDKVFAKVKGYPPWPAQIIAENGKKYNVEFYGTGETGIIKAEDLSYFLRNKEKFLKPLKRKDYVDAFAQIEEAVKEDGGDGDASINGSDSFSSESNVSINISNTPLNSSIKGIKKGIKRKRSASDKSTESGQSPVKRTPNTDKEEIESKYSINKNLSPSKEEAHNSKGFEFVPIDDGIENISDIDQTYTGTKQSAKEKTGSDFKINIVSEKTLKYAIAYIEKANQYITAIIQHQKKYYPTVTLSRVPLSDPFAISGDSSYVPSGTEANYIKEKESIYKGRPVEHREDYINQVLPIQLPSGIMAGIKLHMEWPLKFDNEYDRALYDESVALRTLEEKQNLESGNAGIPNSRQLLIPNIEMSRDEVTEALYLKDIESKKAWIDRLKIEADLMGLDSKIKTCLGLDKADPSLAIDYLQSMIEINFDELMLKKHPHIVDMVRRLRKYVGNTKEWNMPEASLNEFSIQADKVRTKAENVYAKFKEVVKVPENATSFWEGFTDLVCQFRSDCKNMTEAQINLLCAEPTSRQAFLNNLEEIDSEKENSSGVANAELESIVNGFPETPATES